MRHQQEDRVLFRFVPKKVIDNNFDSTFQDKFTVPDLNFDRKTHLLFNHLPPFSRGSVDLPLAKELESPESQSSFLSEYSPSTSEISDNLLERDLSSDLESNTTCPLISSGTTLESPIFTGISGVFGTVEEVPEDRIESKISNPLKSDDELGLASLIAEDSPALPNSMKVPEELSRLNDEIVFATGQDQEEAFKVNADTETKLQPYSGNFCDDDEEFEFLKLANVRRCSSLKVSNSESGPLNKKKEVRFADALGLDLVSVKHIVATSDPPVISLPLMARRDLTLWGKPDEAPDNSDHPFMQLCPCFSPPGSAGNFINRIYENKIMLETFTADNFNLSVTGSVCVVNIAYVKHIFVRYTTNGWLNHSDEVATFMKSSNGGRIDKFLFKINLPKSFGFGNRMEFAICYQVMNQVYWDNNFKNNYRVECYYK